jgi:hypothetical protein
VARLDALRTSPIFPNAAWRVVLPQGLPEQPTQAIRATVPGSEEALDEVAEEMLGLPRAQIELAAAESRGSADAEMPSLCKRATWRSAMAAVAAEEELTIRRQFVVRWSLGLLSLPILAWAGWAGIAHRAEVVNYVQQLIEHVRAL